MYLANHVIACIPFNLAPVSADCSLHVCLCGRYVHRHLNESICMPYRWAANGWNICLWLLQLWHDCLKEDRCMFPSHLDGATIYQAAYNTFGAAVWLGVIAPVISQTHSIEHNRSMKESANDMKLLWCYQSHIVWTSYFIFNSACCSLSHNLVLLWIFSQRCTVSPSAVFTVTTDTDLEVCELESLPLSFSIMCTVDPAAVILWEVTGVTPPLGGAIARGETVRSFAYPNVIGQTTLNVNDPSRVDVGNQTCFICWAEDLSGNIATSDPLCVDVAGTLILDVTVIVCNSTKL